MDVCCPELTTVRVDLLNITGVGWEYVVPNDHHRVACVVSVVPLIHHRGGESAVPYDRHRGSGGVSVTRYKH